MIQALFGNNTLIALEAALDAYNVRSQLIAHNIANADVPNYKALRLRFEDILAARIEGTPSSPGLGLKLTDPLHLPGHAFGGVNGVMTSAGQIYVEDRTTYRLDGNNVDIDHETAEQAKNAIMYETVTELLDRRFKSLRTAIRGGA